MTVKQIDILFLYLYNKNEKYTTYLDIKKECFQNDDSVDVEGMTIKMHKDGFLDSGAVIINKL